MGLSLAAGPGNATAAGLTAQLHRIFGVQLGNAIASGVSLANFVGTLGPRQVVTNASTARRAPAAPRQRPTNLARS
jgi:hypothetical protein